MTGLQDLTKQCSSKCQGNVDFICATHSLAILRFLCCVVVECGFLFLKWLGSKVSESNTVEHLQGVDFMYTKHHHDQNLKPLHSRDIPHTIQEICAAMHLSSKGHRLQPLLVRWCVWVVWWLK